MDWRQDSDYAFCAQLDLNGWAWQFLRRNPDYQTDFNSFITIWRQLEAAYGAPPHRDFFKWKQDPRAWRSEAGISDCGTEVCPGENDQVLIECWLGAKWGFRKFPPDPAITLPQDLTWREFPIEVESIDCEQRVVFPAEIVALRFDLSLPLPAQLEAAKRRLIGLRQLRTKACVLPPRTLSEGAKFWRRCLRVLDALKSGALAGDIAGTLALQAPDQDIDAALALQNGGYRRLLQLET